MGASAEYLTEKERNLLINKYLNMNVFSEVDHGREIMELAGYGKVSYIFLIRPFLWCGFIFLAILLLFNIFEFIVYRHRHKTQRMVINSFLKDSVMEQVPDWCIPIQVQQHIRNQDILKQKQMDIHEEDTGRIMKYLEDVSHQLKVPMAVILAACERSLTEPAVSEQMELCIQQVGKMQLFLRDLLQLGRFDCERQNMNYETVNAYNLIEVVVNDLSVYAEAKSIEIEMQGNEGICWVCDPRWMEECLSNIIKNSVEHSDGGIISVRFSQDDRNNYVEILDQGCGFQDQSELRIFDRYAWGNRCDKESAGLGMAISMCVIKKHFGNIYAKNRIPVGAEFHISFPRLDITALYMNDHT